MNAPSFDPDVIRPIQLRGRRLDHNLVLAPMAGVSNLPFRLIAAEAGAALVFSETVSARGLINGGRKSWRLLRSSPRESPCAFQLFGAEPEILGEACRLLADEGAEWIDLNVGCPVKKFVRGGAGSALLRDLPRAGGIVRAMRRAFPGTLSVKMRTGWDAASLNAHEFARIAEAEGAELLSVHGRTRCQQYSGKADRAAIRRVVEAVPALPVLANGDISQPDDALSMLRETGAAGVMIGRGAMGNPWLFRQILTLHGEGRASAPTAAERIDTVELHITLMRDSFPDDALLASNLKKYLAAYSKGLPGSAAFRQAALESADLAFLLDHTRRYFGGFLEEQ